MKLEQEKSLVDKSVVQPPTHGQSVRALYLTFVLDISTLLFYAGMPDIPDQLILNFGLGNAGIDYSSLHSNGPNYSPLGPVPAGNTAQQTSQSKPKCTIA